MTATVTHQPKAGATLTGTEYESADHHVVSITAADIGAAATSHTHAQSDVTSLVSDLAGKASTSHDHDSAYAAADHTHEASGLTHPQVLARGLGA